MSNKLFWVSIIARFHYFIAALALLGTLVSPLAGQRFELWGFLFAFGFWLSGLVLDVLAEIGQKIVRMETEQALIRVWIQQLRP